MCGVGGFWRTSGARHESLAIGAARMAESLRHRGPDDAGIFVDADAGLALAHRRLAVIDRSVLGHQPMSSPSGRFVVTYNGEIFNHAQIRDEFEADGFAFHGHSDTEVILAAIERWGLVPALRRFVGMFAFALWDRSERVLTLVRDRMGIKPMYFGWIGRTFAFASELKAIRATPGFENPVNRGALALLLQHGYIPAPHSIYQGIYKLYPGTVLRIDRKLAEAEAEISELTSRSKTFWSIQHAAEAGAANLIDLPDAEAVSELDRLLRDSVALRMEADVPLGAFLSGGIDSSTVVALMQSQTMRPVKTFSVGFHERAFDEAPQARQVAAHLGTEHRELYVTARDALDVVPQLSTICDEPFADPATIPTWLLARLAKQSVTVSLSGDGGDELFCGYNRYMEAERYRRLLNPLSPGIRRMAANALNSEHGVAARSIRFAASVLPAALRPRNPTTAWRTLAGLLSARDDDERYVRLITQWDGARHVVLGAGDLCTQFTNPEFPDTLSDPLAKMMYMDQKTYLPDDCLNKVDRASMAVSLEARVPLLDHRVVEFAWMLPARLKVRHRQGKWLLRQLLYRYVPPALADRPKKGFAVPIGDWLRGPLREWAEALLSEDRLRNEGYFEVDSIRALWNGHLNYTVNEPYRLWSVLMFQAWLAQLQHCD